MKKYDFGLEEQEMLKVAKMNQDISLKALQQAKELNKQVERQLTSDEAFLSQIEAQLGVIPQKQKMAEIPYERKVPTDKPWDSLVAEADSMYIDDIGFEDLLSEQEFLNAYKHLDEINAQFARQTGLKKVDWLFLITAIALQCTRQYVLDPWIKRNLKGATSQDEIGRKGNATPGWYHADTDKILTNRVPFDCNRYSENSTVKGFLKGGNHRMVTLGHDPLLGWIFGTANILTSTMTKVNMTSAHVKWIPGKGNTIYALADTGRVFTACKDRIFNEGMDGKIAVGSAIIREAIHLKSDIDTKFSLPLPVVSTVSPDFARELAEYGINMASVGTEMSLSLLINALVSMIHRLFYDDSMDAKMYEVRTRKIILYSNVIASTSNVIVAYIKKDPAVLDVGGLIVTIIRLFNDVRFIARVKEEFVNSQLDIHFKGLEEELENLYNGYYGLV